MYPDNKRTNDPITSSSGQPENTEASSLSNQAATNLLRNQIDAIYSNDPNMTTDESTAPQPVQASERPIDKPADQPSRSAITAGPGAINIAMAPKPTQTESPYERTHSDDSQSVDGENWKKYHSAWQSYYQQYYERYYIGQVYNSKNSSTDSRELDPANQELSQSEAIYDLRTKIRKTLETKATKIKKSRHFVPILVACLVMLVFSFLQYNRVVFAAVDAYITPGDMDPTTLIVDPNAAGAVSPDPKLIIPKINVNVPIIWDANASDENSLNAAMDKGVAWFNIQGASARPGEIGNFALSGHSSNDWLDSGDYKFIFARLDQMDEGDTIYVDYNSQRYVYVVSLKKVVKPTDVSALTNPTDTPEITLITCTPLGTALNRLLVFAKQVSPDPSTATTVESTSTATASQMPANSPTFLQRLFGGGK
ncbi:MAG: class D sortase [Candidatus Saccharimonas sp.]